MPRMLRLAALAIAAASAMAGAVAAVLPALVLGFASLFYNGAGGALIFLGNLIGLLPHPLGVIQGPSSLPIFRQLDTGAVVLLSVAATVLCSVAAALVVAPIGDGDRRPWLVVGLCCLVAAIAGGHSVALCVVPAVAVSVGQLIGRRLYRGS
jgi:hypothetical protein